MGVGEKGIRLWEFDLRQGKGPASGLAKCQPARCGEEQMTGTRKVFEEASESRTRGIRSGECVSLPQRQGSALYDIGADSELTLMPLSRFCRGKAVADSHRGRHLAANRKF
jgi:hypothetical protein